MRLRQLARGMLGVMAGVGLSLALTGPALAADHTMHTDDGDPGGRVEFTANGDVVRLCDIEADGWAVGLYVYDVNQNLYKYGLQAGGNGTCKTARASDGG